MTLGALIYAGRRDREGEVRHHPRLRMTANARSGRCCPAGCRTCWCSDTVQRRSSTGSARRASSSRILRDAGHRADVLPRHAVDRRRRSSPTRRRRPRRSTASRTTSSGRSTRRARSSTSTAARSSSGIVRDSTLNSTNDFQMFGETFGNVARLAPAQAAYWVTSDSARPASSRPPEQPGPASNGIGD